MSPKPITPFRVAVALAAIYLIWGSTYLAIRFAVETIPPFLMAGTRFVLAGSSLYAWLWLRGVGNPSRAQWRAGAIAGALMMLGGNGLLSWSEQYVPSGLAALLVTTAPLWIVAFAWLGARGEAARPLEIAGLLIGLGGAALLLTPEAGDGGGERMYLFGAIAVLLASISWAAGSIYSRRAELPALPLMGAAVIITCGGALQLATGVALGEPRVLDLSAVSSAHCSRWPT